MAANKPLLAIVGRPNVGKSTLFNRFVGGRPALVHDTPGLTRDRRYGEFDYFGREFRVVDTGGLDPDAAREVIGAGIHRQAHQAISEADAILFLLDGAAGLTPVDHDLAKSLRKTGLPIFCVANKIDSSKRESLINEIFALGIGDVYPISASHGRGIDDLIDAVIEGLSLPPPPPPPVDDEDDEDGEDGDDDPAGRKFGPLRVAFIGKPNVGKSSLVNRLLGVERALVHDQPGTTTDPVDTPFEFAGRSYVLVDTAGIRRRARVEEETEKISVSMALSQLRQVHVAVVVIDGHAGPSEQDARLASAVEQGGRAVVVALNKSDLLGRAGAVDELTAKARDDLRFLAWAPTVLISALRGDGVGDLMDRIDEVAAEHRRRVTTGELNRFFEEVCETHPPPVHHGRPVRIQYLTQARVRPPTFVLWANSPDGVSAAYSRFLVNQLRARYGFAGTPIRLLVKAKKRRERGRKRKRSRRKR